MLQSVILSFIALFTGSFAVALSLIHEPNEQLFEEIQQSSNGSLSLFGWIGKMAWSLLYKVAPSRIAFVFKLVFFIIAMLSFITLLFQWL
ncbi:hypothetical protein [Metabacillus arenae]|uniref:Uncharacterized protein n=1 Tax=Metabacillus arenae TaxID=2771434 RepID=A0A926RWJ3_9BACI|nr:hypothetical protein [Metabacillus arenae]MBD1379966.1 hypothetical protein [Metabacillus arenae]